MEYVQSATDFSEGVAIAKEIARLSGGVDMLAAQDMEQPERVYAFGEIAVLARTHHQLDLIEQCLRHDDIPCIVTGRENYLEQPEVQGVLALFSWLCQPADRPALGAALRMLWNCPEDLVQSVCRQCGEMGELETEDLQRTFGQQPLLASWLTAVESYLPHLKDKPLKLLQQWTDNQPEQTAGTKQQAGADTAEIQTADIQPAEHTDLSGTKQETSDLASQLKDRGKTSQTEEELKVQPENTMAEAGAPVMAEAPRTERAEVPVYENVTTVHVEQPEELPQKVTDQLLSKLAEGVTEFEIHIEPANLGKLAIKVLYEGGQATISIICSEKKAWEALGQNAREIGNIIDRNLGEETTIIVEKQETDYLNQTKDENEQAGKEQQKQKENGKNQDSEDAGDFLQKLRLGLAG